MFNPHPPVPHWLKSSQSARLLQQTKEKGEREGFHSSFTESKSKSQQYNGTSFGDDRKSKISFPKYPPLPPSFPESFPQSISAEKRDRKRKLFKTEEASSFVCWECESFRKSLPFPPVRPSQSQRVSPRTRSFLLLSAAYGGVEWQTEFDGKEEEDTDLKDEEESRPTQRKVNREEFTCQKTEKY